MKNRIRVFSLLAACALAVAVSGPVAARVARGSFSRPWVRPRGGLRWWRPCTLTLRL